MSKSFMKSEWSIKVFDLNFNESYISHKYQTRELSFFFISSIDCLAMKGNIFRTRKTHYDYFIFFTEIKVSTFKKKVSFVWQTM